MRSPEFNGWVRGAVPFTLVGVLLYGALYVAAERLMARHADRNRLHVVKTSPRARYDYVILGASHAAVFDYRDMNARLESMTGRSILNLSLEGAGVVVNRLLLDYFLIEHQTSAVVYVLDSFAFYAAVWNEERLRDARLYQRAPWDPALAWLLVTTPATRPVALDYITGFFKINNAVRFEADRFANEGARFERSYRPVAQIDRQRVRFLYPVGADDVRLEAASYLTVLSDFVREMQARGIRVLILRPPIPARMRAMLPNEDSFDARLAQLARSLDVELYDFSAVNNDETLFFDSDHLNQNGVLRFFEEHLGPLLRGRDT